MKRILILVAILYALLPRDLLPDYLLGWGWIDDILVFVLLWWLFRRFGLKPPVGEERSRGSDHTRGRQEQTGSAQQSEGGPGESGDPYVVLNLPRDAGPEEIKRAYRRLAAQYHPDKVAHLGEEFKALAAKRFRQIQAAYQQLMDQQR